MFNTIRYKFMIPTLFLTVLLLSSLGILLAANSYSGIRAMLAAKADSTADFIAKLSATSYKNFEYYDLDNLANEIRKDAEVDFATFYDAKGVALTKEINKGSLPFLIVERKITDDNGNNLGSLKIGFNRAMIDSNLRKSLVIIGVSILAAILIFLYGMKILSERIVISRLLAMEALSERLADGDMSVEVDTSGSDEIASLGRAMNKMAANLKELIDRTQSRNTELEEWQKNELWFKSGLNDLNSILRVDQKCDELANSVLGFLIDYLGGGVGVFYLCNEKDETLHVVASYALADANQSGRLIQPGEGLAGQAALEKKIICIDSVPHHYLPIGSALGEADPINIVVFPIIHNEQLLGVLEIGSFKRFNDNDFSFLNQAAEGIAIAINASRSRELVRELLENAQHQAEELRVQHEELQQTNEELAERAKMLAEQRNYNIY